MTVPPHDAKRARELRALRFIYDDRALSRVEHCDRPDFILQSSPARQPFGVEVTEIHASESAARLRHVPGYVAQLIDGHIRHKLDARLTVGPVEFRSPDGKKTSGRAVAIDPIPPDAYLAALAEAIQRKGTRANQYRSDVSHTNLIILDYAEPFVLAAPDVANTVIFDDAVWSAIFAARFNEIYLVTRVTPQSADRPERGYIPLRQMLFAATAMMLPSAVRKLRPRYRFATSGRRAAALWDYLEHSGVAAHFSHTADYAEVGIQAIGIRFDAGGAIQVLDYLDAPVPSTERRPRFRADAPWRDSRFDSAFQVHRTEQFVKFSHFLPARSID